MSSLVELRRSSLQLNISRCQSRITSRSTSQFVSGNDVNSMSDEDLVKLVTNLKRVNKILDLENQLLESSIMRVEPSLMHGVQQAYDYAIKCRSSTNLNFTQSGFWRSPSRLGSNPSSRLGFETSSKILISPSRVTSRRADSTSRSAIFSSGVKINIAERSELIGVETQLVYARMEKARRVAASKHALLRARLEEIGIRNAAVDKAMESFDQQVIIKGCDRIAKRIPAETWIKYMVDSVNNYDKDISRLRLKISTADAQYSKLKGQIHTKAELSESLRPVDFEKIIIENTACIETIDKKLKQLASLKGFAGDLNLNLAILNRATKDQDEILKKYQKDIESKKEKKGHLIKENERIKEETNMLETKLEELKKIRGAHEAPSILEYVELKEELADLKHAIKKLEHRANLQQNNLKSLQKHLQKIDTIEMTVA